MDIKAIILAAGQGTRMHSQIPKVLHPILGKPMLKYVTDACIGAGIEDITVVVSPKNGGPITDELPKSLRFVTQDEPKGTGHAVMAARSCIRPGDDVLILYGDMPLITAEFINTLAGFYAKADADGIVTALYMTSPSDFGRVFASADDMLARIVEYKDLTPNDPHTNLINVGIYLFKGEALLYGLDRVTNQNKQNEYYLTDVPGILRAADRPVKIFSSNDTTLFAGINNQMQLADAAKVMRQRINRRHMQNGVRMLDPATTFIDDTVVIEPGAVIYPNVILEDNCRVGAEAIIGPNVRMLNTDIGALTLVQYSVLLDSVVGASSEIGPFAHLRAGTKIGENTKVGAFVEVKNASVGDYTFATHLAYIGDADVGSNVNYGCGVITCNFDGKEKHHTTIKDNAFIGSNTNLVAPLTVGEGAFTAAGSTITKDVPDNALAIARERQINKPDWKRKV